VKEERRGKAGISPSCYLAQLLKISVRKIYRKRINQSEQRKAAKERDRTMTATTSIAEINTLDTIVSTLLQASLDASAFIIIRRCTI